MTPDGACTPSSRVSSRLRGFFAELCLVLAGKLAFLQQEGARCLRSKLRTKAPAACLAVERPHHRAACGVWQAKRRRSRPACCAPSEPGLGVQLPPNVAWTPVAVLPPFTDALLRAANAPRDLRLGAFALDLLRSVL